MAWCDKVRIIRMAAEKFDGPARDRKGPAEQYDVLILDGSHKHSFHWRPTREMGRCAGF